MKQTILKQLCMTFCLLMSMNVLADVQVGFLKYSLSGNNATVTGYDAETLPEELVIPESIEYNGLTFSVTDIGPNAFKGCNKITSLITTEKVASIGGSAFYQCPNLKQISIHGNVGEKCFYGCTNLQTATISSKNILAYAFYGCTNIEKVVLDGVVDIYGYAFYNCSKIKSVDFGKSLERIGTYAFGNCTSLTYLVFPNTLYKICPTYSASGYYDDWGTSKNSSNYNYRNVYSPFTGCNIIQSVIFLGSARDTGLSNVTINRGVSSFLTWNVTEFQYTGIAPTLSFTNNLPAGFVATAYDMSKLEKDAGKHTVNIPVTFANADMSFDVDIPYTYTINPITAKAKVQDAARLYGDNNPVFETVYSGFINGEDANVVTTQGTYSTEATVRSDVGTYSIHQSGATAQNYVFDYEDGTLTVNKAPLSIKANDKSMTYGSQLPTLDMAFDGLKNNETQPKWKIEPILECNATTTSKVGIYPIMVLLDLV